MSKTEDKLNQLHTRLENLARYEAAFKREISDIRREIVLLKTKPGRKTGFTKHVPKPPIGAMPASRKENRVPPKSVYERPDPVSTPPETNIEQYIGKYLISVIGVLVTIIGVGIGAKYAIDNNWITPFMRIVFGYAVGLSLVGFAVHLKEKYHTYSSVLISGGMAIMYFVTYFAFAYYALISQPSAFALMVIFTVFTVISSIIYDRQIIAHIGLVGAYAVPFMLSEGSDRIGQLFGYIAIINVGILVLSLIKYWKPLLLLSFGFTWIIYGGWFVNAYSYPDDFVLALTFLSIFSVNFYLTFIGSSLLQNIPFSFETIPLTIYTAFAFFGFGHTILNVEGWAQLLGLFAIFNAFIHFSVAAILQRLKIEDKIIFYLSVVLALTFLTIAVPVQFEGNWITLLWMAEGTFLFVVGRTKRIPLFENISYVVVALASLSLLNDWTTAYLLSFRDASSVPFPLLNNDFLVSLFVACGFAIIYAANRDEKYESQTNESLDEFVRYLLPIAFLIVLYNTFRIEIGNYFQYREIQMLVENQPTIVGETAHFTRDRSLEFFNVVWQLIYSMFFLTVLSFVNIRKIKNATFGFVNLGLNSIVMLVFITLGLFALGVLRRNYVSQIDVQYFDRGIDHILVRYIAFGFLALLIFACYRYIKQRFINEVVEEKYLALFFEVGLCFTLLIILSNELINWTDILSIEESYKLGLSVLWGLYGISLVIIGIIQRKKHVRLFAIALFALTLLKLFIYDVAELETIPKTILFVLIGILLLIASFLYNKYTNLIFDDENID